MDVEFYEGDVTALRDAEVGSGFSRFLDVGTRARRGPLPPGASREDVASAFEGWQILEEQPYQGEMPGPLKNAAPRWYRLARS